MTGVIDQLNCHGQRRPSAVDEIYWWVEVIGVSRGEDESGELNLDESQENKGMADRCRRARARAASLAATVTPFLSSSSPLPLLLFLLVSPSSSMH